MCGSRLVTLTVGFKPVVWPLPDAKLKPKIQGDYCSLGLLIVCS